MDYGAENQFQKLRDVVVVAPDNFEIVRQDTPWQKKYFGSIDVERAKKEHRNLVDTLEKLGVRCHFLPLCKSPEQKDARDVGLITKKGAIIARQKSHVKKGEAEAFISFCTKNKIPILGEVSFEGGDFFSLKKPILGIGNRTEKEAVEALEKLLGKPIEPIKHSTAHHLDGAFNMATRELCVVDKRFVSFKECISVSSYDFLDMASNFLVIKEGHVLADIHPFNDVLRKHGITVTEVDVSELKKSGGSIRCMTLPLFRD